jgi:DinB superfamily
MKRYVDEDFSTAEFRECVLDGAQFIGVVMRDAEIDGLVTNLVVNGVEVTAYVEAELDRRHPVRVLIRSDVPAELLEGWRQLGADWTATIDRLRASPGLEHRAVNGEWSALQTLRHLVFVHDSWFRRCVLGSTAPFTPIGFAPEFVPDRESQGLDLAAVPSLDEVVAVRVEQAAELDEWLTTVTPAQLAATAPIPEGDGWPPYARGRSTRQCLGTVLNEEWAHHGFCVRDLDLAETSTP